MSVFIDNFIRKKVIEKTDRGQTFAPSPLVLEGLIGPFQVKVIIYDPILFQSPKLPWTTTI